VTEDKKIREMIVPENMVSPPSACFRSLLFPEYCLLSSCIILHEVMQRNRPFQGKGEGIFGKNSMEMLLSWVIKTFQDPSDKPI